MAAALCKASIWRLVRLCSAGGAVSHEALTTSPKFGESHEDTISRPFPDGDWSVHLRCWLRQQQPQGQRHWRRWRARRRRHGHGWHGNRRTRRRGRRRRRRGRRRSCGRAPTDTGTDVHADVPTDTAPTDTGTDVHADVPTDTDRLRPVDTGTDVHADVADGYGASRHGAGGHGAGGHGRRTPGRRTPGRRTPGPVNAGAG